MIIEKVILLPPEIIDGVIALAGAIFGWFSKWLASKKKDEAMKAQNEKMKEIIIEYDSAAREALRSARKPGPPHKPPGSEGGNNKTVE